ncbi:lipin, N-terminal conserved region-domain-containing protein, partial [Pilobolus umbonatus]
MEYVGKLGNLISSVHNFYNEINPATLSGAIDIIVVEQEDGDLACSPFHVRFGKLSVLMPQEKRVQIRVNDELVPYVMKVGEAGEAFFVFETDHEVPEEFQTSPIMEALPEKNEEDPPYLDIGESKNQNKVVEQKTADSFEDDEKEGHKSQASLPAELQSPKMIIEEQMDKVVTKLDPFHKTNESSTPNVLGDSTDPLLKEDDISNIVMNDDVPKNDIYPLEDGSTLLERVIPEAITTTTIAKERFIVRPASGDIYSTWLDVTHTANHNRVENEKIKNDLNTINDSVDESGHGRGDESIVLDISGYKTGNVDEAWDEMDHSDHLETTTDPLVETISISHSNNDRARLHKPNEHTASSIIKIMAENVFNKANNHANRNMNEANADAADKEVKIYGGSAEKEIEEDATEKGDGAENEVREDGAENEVREDGAENEAREDATEKG